MSALLLLLLAPWLGAFADALFPGPGPGRLLFSASPSAPDLPPPLYSTSCPSLHVSPSGAIFTLSASEPCPRFSVLLRWPRRGLSARLLLLCRPGAPCRLLSVRLARRSPSSGGGTPLRFLLPRSALALCSAAALHAARLACPQVRRRRRRRRRAASEIHFVNDRFAMEVTENLTPRVVGSVRAEDPEGRTIGYSMRAVGNSQSDALFDIDAQSGTVRTKAKLDREALARHDFRVFAFQTGVTPSSAAKTATATLRVTVKDANDQTPVCEESVYSVRLKEGPVTSSNSLITTVVAKDADEGNNAAVRYSLADRAVDGATFAVDATSGAVTAKAKAFDREQRASYDLKVLAVDQATAPEVRLTGTCTVSLVITDANDNKPVFQLASYSAVLREDRPLSAPPFLTIQAKDADLGRNADVAYSIVSGDEGEDFALNPRTGELRLRKMLDHERKSSYSLEVRARDNGTTSLWSLVKISIIVLDLNDVTPTFSPPSYALNVLESKPVNELVVKVVANDADSGPNGTVTYSLVPPTGLPFRIEASTGRILLSAALDREKIAFYNFSAVARDGGRPPLSSSAHVLITVDDVNDNRPTFSAAEFRKEVSENAAVGAELMRVTAVDKDEGNRRTVRYVLQSGNEEGFFRLETRLGTALLSLAKSLTGRRGTTFSLRLVASDQGTPVLSSSAILRLQVTAANLHQPRFVDLSGHISVLESHPLATPIYTFRAIDDDGAANGAIGTVTFSIDREANKWFRVNATSGELFLRQQLDHEATKNYPLRVTARDGADPPKSAAQDVQVRVLDVNDNAPRFDPARVEVNVSEDASVDSLVAQLTARDADEVSRIVYRLVDLGPGAGGAPDFRVESNSGKVRVAKPLDRERRPTYRLSVIAVDSTPTGNRSGSALLLVSLLDVNDNKPVWPADPLRLSVPENSGANTLVGRLRASDADAGPNARLEYALKRADGRPSDLFFLRPAVNNSVDVFVRHSNTLDFERGPKVHVLRVTASSLQLFTEARLEIHVTDVNDNAPVFEDFVLQLDNFEGHFPVGPVARVPAVDPDVTSQLRFRLLSGADLRLMSVNTTTGDIELHSRLNSDVDINAQLRIEVTDGIFTVAATCNLRTRFVSLLAVQSSVSLHLSVAPAPAVPALPAFSAAVAALFSQPASSFLLLDLQPLNASQSGALSLLTFAVKDSAKGSAHANRFLKAKAVREKVFLRTGEIEAKANLKVIPHDDGGLCLLEPCGFFHRCSEQNSFLSAPAFRALSPRLLLRPIRALLTASCECPPGFADLASRGGCDQEVNLCFSRPCLNGGSCVPTEGGFLCVCSSRWAGRQCQVARVGPSAKLTPPLPKDLCQPPSHLVPLIAGGFVCENCTRLRHEGTISQQTPFCQLRWRRFLGSPGGYLALPPLHQRSHFSVRLSFASAFSAAADSSLLLYAGRYSGTHDRLILRLLNGSLHALLSLGDSSNELQLSLGPDATNQRFDDGSWHVIGLELANRTLTLSRGDCDVGVASQLKPEDSPCAVSGRLSLPQRCSSGLEQCFRFLDTATPLYLGGRPDSSVGAFRGCLGDVFLDGRRVDLRSEAVSSRHTEEGCPEKRGFCTKDICKNGGTCLEAWNRHFCDCPAAFSGLDCSVPVPTASVFSLRPNASFEPHVELSFAASPTAHLPERIGLDFRARELPAANASLFTQTTVFATMTLQLLAGNQLLYSYNPARAPLLVSCDGQLRLRDGRWHRAEVLWTAAGVTVRVDDGVCAAQQNAALTTSSQPIRMAVAFGRGLSGCIRRLSVAWGSNVTAPPSPDPDLRGAVTDCPGALGPGDPDGCARCPTDAARGSCVRLWRHSVCRCRAGHAGADCGPICGGRADPCREEGGRCELRSSEPRGYRCVCPPGRSGPYCGRRQMTVCAPSWWGAPLCGPCSCDLQLGLDPNCNSTTGECACRANYYRASAASTSSSSTSSATCRPCSCYALGTADVGSCESDGSCRCRTGVMGAKCNACPDAFAEVTRDGCEVQYSACPQAFADDVLWRRTALDAEARQTCPDRLAGYATRKCSKLDGWLTPDTRNCTAKALAGLEREISQLEAGRLAPTEQLVVRFASVAASALQGRSLLFGGDVRVGSRAVRQILQFEAGRKGLNLSHTQDKKFVPNLMTAVSALLGPSTRLRWKQLRDLYPSPSPAELVELLGRYSATLAKQTDIRTDVDYVIEGAALRVLSLKAPSNSSLPVSALVASAPTSRPPSNVSLAISGPSLRPGAALALGTVFLTNLTGLMDKSDTSPSKADQPGPLEVSSGVLALEAPSLDSSTATVALQFSVVEWESRLDFRCVFWKDGDWSSEGCVALNRSEVLDGYVRCLCSHLSIFAVLARRPPLRPKRYPVAVPVGIYVLGALSLACLLPAVLVLALVLRTGFNCLAIHFHHCLCAAAALLIYLCGLRAIDVPVVCKLTGVFSSFFSLCSLAWLAVDALHLFRRLSEVRDVDVGRINFYLFLGYGLPGLSVSLAVALRAEDFGELSHFCWVPLASPTALSVLLPYAAALLSTAVLLVMSCVRMRRAALLSCPPCVCRRTVEAAGSEEGEEAAEEGGRALGHRRGQVRARQLPSSLRYNRPDLLTSISRADSRRSLSRPSSSSSSCCSSCLSSLSSRVERFASGPGWPRFHLAALCAVLPPSALAWLALYLAPASLPSRPSLWLVGGVAGLLASLLASLLYTLLHARVLPALRALKRHGGTLPKEMRATALGTAAAGRYAPNPALEAEFHKLGDLAPPAGASTSSTTTTSGGVTVVPGVYLAATSTDTSTLATGTPIALAGFSNGVLAASQEEDESEEDEEDGATMTSGDFGVDLASSHSSDDEEDEEEDVMGPRWRLPEAAGRRQTPSVHSSSQPTTTTDDTLYGSTARLIPAGAAAGGKTHAVYDNPALVLSVRDLASVGTAWSSASSPPLTADAHHDSDEEEGTAV